MAQKKLKLLLAPIMMAMLLSSCSMNSSGGAAVGPRTDNPKEYITQNLVDSSYVRDVKSYKLIEEDPNLVKYDLVNREMENYGVVVLQNESGHLGFYNLLHQKFIIKPSYFNEWTKYRLFKTDAGVFIGINYEDNLTIYDQTGNIVCQREYFPVEQLVITSSLDGDKVVVIVEPFEAYELQEDGTYQVYDFDDSSSEPDDENPFSLGLLFTGERMDMDEIGYPQYYMQATEEGLISVFKKEDNKNVSTFYVEDMDGILVGKTYIVQKVYSVAHDAIKYNYVEDGNKYCLQTYATDLLTGKTKVLDYPYKIFHMESYLDKQGHYTLAIMDAYPINEYGVKLGLRTYLVDESLNVKADYTGLDVTNFTKVGDNYYNYSTEILYDSNFKPITYFAGFNPRLIKHHNLFILEYKGLYGLADSNGNLIENFYYSNIIIDPDYDNAIFQFPGDVDFFLRTLDGTEGQLFNGSLRTISENNGIYAAEDDNKYTIFSLDGTIFKSEEAYSGYSYSGISMINSLVDNDFINISYNNQNLGHMDHTIIMLNANQDHFRSHGDEVIEKPHTGKTKDDAIELSLGTRKYHLPENGLSYVSFTPLETGVYNLRGVDVFSYFILNQNGMYHEVLEDATNIMKANETYVFSLDQNSYSEITLECDNTSKPLTNENIPAPSDYQLIIRELMIEDGGYISVTSSAPHTIYSYVDGAGFDIANIAKENINDKTYLVTKPGVNYVFAFEATPGEAIEIKVNELDNSSFEELQLDYNYSLTKTTNYFKYKPAHDGYYCFSTSIYGETSFMFNGKLGHENILNVGEIVNINGKDVVYLTANCYHTVKFVDNGPAEGTFTVTEFSEKDAIYSSSEAGVYGSKLYKYSPNETGYYSINGSEHNEIFVYKEETEGFAPISTRRIKGNHWYAQLEEYAVYYIYLKSNRNTSSNYAVKKINPMDLTRYSNGYQFDLHDETQIMTYQVHNNGLYEFDGLTATLTIYKETSEGVSLVRSAHNRFEASRDAAYIFIFEGTQVGYLNLRHCEDNAYKFYRIETGTFEHLDDIYYSTNHADSSSSQLIISAFETCHVSFDIRVSSENNYDKAKVTLNGTDEYVLSGERKIRVNLIINPGDTLIVSYQKDSSRSYGDDMVVISNICFY